MKEQKRVYLAFWSNWLPIWDLLFFNDDENLEEKGLIKKLPKEFFAEFKSIEEPKRVSRGWSQVLKLMEKKRKQPSKR